MNPRELFFNHVEKFLVGLVGLYCSYHLFSVWDDPESRPKANRSDVEAIIDEIDKAATKPGGPNFEQPTDFRQQVEVRLAQKVSARQSIQFLTAHFSGAKEQNDEKPKLFVFEILTPQITIEDRVGSLKVKVSVPSGIRKVAGGQSIVDGLDSPLKDPWHREVGRRGTPLQVKNTATVVGMRIEMAEGRDDPPAWKPFPGTQDGYLPRSQWSQELMIANTVGWETYRVRAQLVVKATGVPIGGTGAFGEEILVLSSPLPAKMSDTEAVEYLSNFMRDLDLHREIAGRAPSMSSKDLPSVSVSGSEKLYTGQWTLVRKVAEADLRVMLVSLDASDPTKPPNLAKVMISRIQRDANGQVQTVVGPFTQAELKVGDMIGKPNIPISTGGLKVMFDFSTPFQIKRIANDAKRELYHRILKKNKPGDDQQKELVLDTRIREEVEVITVTNVRSGETFDLIRPETVITPPHGSDPFFPALPKDGLKEKDIFQKDPLNFRQPQVTIPKPIRHEDPSKLPATVPAAIRQDVTLPFWEMPDGRFVCWLKLNRKVEIFNASPATPDSTPPPPPPVVQPAASGPVPKGPVPKGPHKPTGP